MNVTLQNKLQQLVDRFEEVKYLLTDPKTFENQTLYKELNQEYAQLNDLVEKFKDYQATLDNLAETESLLGNSDKELVAMAKADIEQLQQQKESLFHQLQILLLPKDKEDNKNVFLEIRAGTGGDEASIFAGDLFRMYQRFIERIGWKLEVLSSRLGDHGGFKEIICRVMGESVYAKLKFESGAHRVQRVPKTESQGRIHTSACTVAILPELDSLEEITIDKSEYRLDTFRASGKGGQHVNKTDSAIRITHIESGIVVECQEERSQHKNKAKALAVLQAKLNDLSRQQQIDEHSSSRKQLVGSGDRSERIRTYNYPQGRVTDHRINLTLYNLEALLEGELEQIIEPLINEYHAQQLVEQNYV